MKKTFQDFATYIRLHDGCNKPRINFQNMYKLFPEFEFRAMDNFGSYTSFGQAFEAKNYNMEVIDKKGNSCILIYKEYQDANENLAYIS